MIRILEAAILMIFLHLLSAHIVLSDQNAVIKFDEKGAFSVEVDGTTKIRGSLFLWHDDWQYATPSGVELLGISSLRGMMPKPGVTNGYISYTQTIRHTADGGADVALVFRRNDEIHLTRGIFMLLQFETPEMAKRDIVFTHGPPAIVSRDYRTAAKGLKINVSESIALNLSLDRAALFERRGGESRTAMNVRLSSDADKQVIMRLRFTPAFDSIESWQPEPRHAQLAIHDVKLSMDKVPQFHIVHATVDLSATYDNPFDPEDIKVDAEFIAPSGRKMRLPGFLYQGFDALYEDDLELLSLDGKPMWKVRFAPMEIGTYSMTISAMDRSGSVASEQNRFECVESDSKGFPRISEPPAPGTPRYFEFPDGDALFLIGHNMPTYSPLVEEYFGRMESGGENYNRFWMYRNALGLEWGQPVGTYRLIEAWRLDKVLEASGRHSIYLMLCFDTHQDFREAWKRNPYNKEQDGPCKDPLDFFTNERARRLYKKRLRYIVARWTAYTHILAWEFMNEVEGWRGTQQNREIVAEWNGEMGRTLRALDPYDRPISNSLWTTAGWPELWNLPEMDFVQSHFYANGPKDMALAVANISAQKRADYPAKLHMFAEYGIMSGRGTRQNDPSGVHLHNGNWAGLMSGAASVPVSWWHESYIDPLNLYKVFRGIANFMASEEDLAKHAWKPLRVASVSYIQPPERLEYTDVRFTGAGGNWERPTEAVFTVKEDGTVENGGYLPSLIHGHVHEDLRVPLVFRLDFPTSGQFILHIGKVGDNGLLKFYLDGEEVSTVDLPTGEGLGHSSTYVERWKRWETTYDKDIAVSVPAGKHEIKIQNDGRDWVTVEYFRLTSYRTNATPDLRVMGMQTPRKALAWIQNRAYTWFNVRDGASIPLIAPTRLELSGFSDGEYEIELWDTVGGTVMERMNSTALDGKLVVELPELHRDVAVKIR